MVCKKKRICLKKNVSQVPNETSITNINKLIRANIPEVLFNNHEKDKKDINIFTKYKANYIYFRAFK